MSFKIAHSQIGPTSVYTELAMASQPNLKDDLTVELALMQYYGIPFGITTFPFSKYASSIFAQRKPNGRLRLLLDLRKINNLFSDNYVATNHPVSNLSDAAQHPAVKKLFGDTPKGSVDLSPPSLAS